MGLFRKNNVDPEHFATMQEQMRVMAERLDRSDADKVVLEDRVVQLDAENKRLVEQVEAADGATEREQQLAEQLEGLARMVDEQRGRLADLALVATAAHARAEEVDTEELKSQIGKIAEKMAALDGRVAQVSTELTNQLTEVGGEIDHVNKRVEELEGAELADGLADVRDGQTRLANEQARYEIQFRQDLAEVAERIRRPGGR